MRREYVKPQWFCEEFCLSEHIAKGCGITTGIRPGGSVTVDRVCCEQVQSKADATGGQGHWDGRNITIYDDNKNGAIDWEEIVKYVGKAINGTVTGGGHKGHSLAIKLPDEEYEIVHPLNS